MLPNKSRSRRLEYRWLDEQRKNLSSHSKALDLGGVRDAEYHSLLGLNSDQVVVWNGDPSSRPDQKVDLDQIPSLPAYPKDCTLILAFNLLEHLYRPLELLKWSVQNLPVQGELLIVVPFMYGIHPSPADYWRMTPQLFERFFSDLETELKVGGELQIDSLGEDYREASGPLTATWYKSGRADRLMGAVMESAAFGFSRFATALGRGTQIRDWAQAHPLAIGVRWRKLPWQD